MKENSKNLAGKIISIVVIALIAVIAITTVIFGICQKSYTPVFSSTDATFDSYSTIDVKGTKVLNSGYTYFKDDEEHKEVIKNINDKFFNAFSESSLNALFNGRLGFNSEVTKNDATISTVSSLESYLTFNFTNKDSLPSFTYDNENLAYDKLLIKIEKPTINNISQVKIYYVLKNENSSSYYSTTYANFYDLFKYIYSLDIIESDTDAE